MIRKPASDTHFFWVPQRLRRVLRPFLEDALLVVERQAPSIDYMLPCGVRRIYLHHIKKTGGSSLFMSFLALGGEDPQSVESRIAKRFLRSTTSGPYVFCGQSGNPARRVIERGGYFFAYSHIPAHEIRLPAGTFTITILRDPVERVISYYSYLLSGRATDGMRQFAEGGFHAFLDRLPRRELLYQLHMFSSQFDVNEAVDRLCCCSVVLRTEYLDQSILLLNDRLKLSLQPRHDRVTPAKAELAPDEYERLRALLDLEYELLERFAESGSAGPALGWSNPAPGAY